MWTPTTNPVNLFFDLAPYEYKKPTGYLLLFSAQGHFSQKSAWQILESAWFLCEF